MRKKYANQLFILINELGFSPNNFTIVTEMVEGLMARVFKYKDSSFSFIIRNADSTYEDFDYRFTLFAPDFPFSEFYPSTGFSNFDGVLEGFKDWISCHLKEYLEDLEEPDLWATIQAGDRSLNIDYIDFRNTDNFSASERNQVSMLVAELKLLIHTQITNNAEQDKVVNERLDYLVSATNRLNKYDWKGLVISTMIGIITTLTLDVEKGQRLIEIFKRIFSNLPRLS